MSNWRDFVMLILGALCAATIFWGGMQMGQTTAYQKGYDDGFTAEYTAIENIAKIVSNKNGAAK